MGPISWSRAFPDIRRLAEGFKIAPYVQEFVVMGQNEGKEWAASWAKSAGAGIQKARKARKMTVQRLSERCTELGYPIPRSTLTNLELGRKEALVVQELVVIAEALRIPPVELLFPGLVTGQTEFLPGQTTMTWHALRHFTGETPFPGVTAMTDQPEYHLSLMRQLDYSGRRYLDLLDELDQARKTGDEANIERVQTRIAELRDYERLLKQTLHKAGYTIDLDNTDV